MQKGLSPPKIMHGQNLGCLHWTEKRSRSANASLHALKVCKLRVVASVGKRSFEYWVMVPVVVKISFAAAGVYY